jgi:hypothetical protein
MPVRSDPLITLLTFVLFLRFILLDTTDRSEMMRVMMQLRSKAFPSTGDYVMARLRASMVSQTAVDVYSTLPTMDALDSAVLLNPKKKKKKKRSKNRKKKSSSGSVVSAISATTTDTTSMVPRPPMLTEEDFPSLQSDDKVEWITTPRVDATCEDSFDEEDGDDDDDDDDSASEESTKVRGEEEDLGKSLKASHLSSDGASTATTTSSNASSSLSDPVAKQQVVLGGYAAALLNGPAAPVTAVGPSDSNSSNNRDAPAVVMLDETCQEAIPIATAEFSAREKEHSGLSSSIQRDIDSVIATTPSSPTAHMSWGGNRSFASVLRQSVGRSMEKQ